MEKEKKPPEMGREGKDAALLKPFQTIGSLFHLLGGTRRKRYHRLLLGTKGVWNYNE